MKNGGDIASPAPNAPFPFSHKGFGIKNSEVG